jgi:Coenzyme PQQ synthesis protein D (PqqD)
MDQSTQYDPAAAPAPSTSLPAAKVRVPQHVVYRSFPSETVVLNLQTGRYYGLNATAGEMLAELERAPSVRAAAIVLARTFERPREAIERDLCELCGAMLERGLIETDGSSAP